MCRTRLSELSCCGPDLHVIPTNLPSWDHNFVYWWCSVIATCQPAPEGPEQLIPKVCKGPNRTSERRKNRWVIRNHIMHRNKLWWRPLLSISEFSNGSWPPIVVPEWNYLATACQLPNVPTTEAVPAAWWAVSRKKRAINQIWGPVLFGLCFLSVFIIEYHNDSYWFVGFHHHRRRSKVFLSWRLGTPNPPNRFRVQTISQLISGTLFYLLVFCPKENSDTLFQSFLKPILEK